MNSVSIQQTFETAVRHHQAGRLKEAEAIYQQILAEQPAHFQTLHLLGVICVQTGRHDRAIELIHRALDFQPRWPEAHANLGAAYQAAGQLSQAIAAYRMAVNLNPQYVDARYNLGNALKHHGEFGEAIECFERILAARPEDRETRSILLFISHYLANYDPAAVAQMHREWNSLYAQPVAAERDYGNDRNPDRRLRIGYVSPDFRDHPVGRFLLPLLTCRDKSSFEVFAYTLNEVADSLTKEIGGLADQWRSLVGISDAQAAEQIRRDNIDILIDLAGHTYGSRLLIFARKPAPIQVTFLGYPDTTGLDTMDYRLTDEYADPIGKTEQFHSEKLIRLSPCAWCFRPMQRPPVHARQLGPITFGCFNAFSKITKPMLEVWSGILRAVPDSLLVLKSSGLEDASIRQRFLGIMREFGVDPNRLVMQGREPDYLQHLKQYAQIDIALDTFPYHGTATTCEALWMGVPVVTLAGQSHVSRVGVSLLSNIGMPELAADSVDEYVRIAVALAKDLPRLSDLRLTLRTRMEASPLMDARRFAGNVESALRGMWREWCGHPSKS